MQYTTIPNESAEVREADKRKDAVDADIQALAAEAELETWKSYLKAGDSPSVLLPGPDGKPTGETLGDRIAKLEEAAQAQRTRRNRKFKRAGMAKNDNEARKERLRWFNEFQIPNLEGQHKNHAKKLAEREEALAVTGVDAVEGAARTLMEQQVEFHMASMKNLDELWDNAIKMRDALKPKAQVAAQDSQPEGGTRA